MRLGIDLGGTKTEIVALGPEGAELWRRRMPTPQGYGPILDSLAALAAEAAARTGCPPRGVGLGIPGSLNPGTGLVRNANTTALNGRALARDLAPRLPAPLRVANDANCFALAEAAAGAGRGARMVFGVILGTGVGGGIALDGRVWEGANRIAGEWGHNPLPRPESGELPGPDCYCGRRGCIETWLSGPGLARDHAAHGGAPGDAAAIAARAAAGEPAARASLARHLDRLGRALAGVVNILDPDAIVLGGGLSNLAGLAQALPGAMRPHVFSDRFATPVRAPALGDAAGALGAAWLWPAADAPAAPDPSGTEETAR